MFLTSHALVIGPTIQHVYPVISEQSKVTESLCAVIYAHSHCLRKYHDQLPEAMHMCVATDFHAKTVAKYVHKLRIFLQMLCSSAKMIPVLV